LAYFSELYELARVPVLARVPSGPGGESMLAKAQEVLRDGAPELHDKNCFYRRGREIQMPRAGRRGGHPPAALIRHMMKFHRPGADIFVPDHAAWPEAVARTTHLGIGAHQDDLEFFAVHGILACYGRDDRWFTGVTVTDGAGSARAGVYEKFTDAQMMQVRRTEQRKAAVIGEYAAMIQLDYPSGMIKDHGQIEPVEDLAVILAAARPEVLYVHNPADKHVTHVAVLARCLAAVRRLPPAVRPRKIYGCEVWRDLDWLPDERKVALPVGDRTHLQAALNGVFDSQISGGKRYDLAVMGRRLEHATFHESHATDKQAGLVFAVDLTPLATDEALSLEKFSLSLLEEFAADVRTTLRGVGG